MTTFTIEISRTKVTPSQFLAYVRAAVDAKHGDTLRSDLDLDYFRRGDDLNFDITHEDGTREKSTSKPYEMQTFVKHTDGSMYNEICEFEFDNDKTGHGYYYLVNVEAPKTAQNTTNDNENPNNGAEAENATGSAKTSENATRAPQHRYINRRTEERTNSASIALQWHRDGDTVQVDTLNKRGALIGSNSIEGAQQRAIDENWEHCKHIADEIDDYCGGRVFKCPECGETFKVSDDREKHRCSCGYVDDIDEFYPQSIYDYLEDVYDIEYRIGSDKELRSVQIMVACGGPNIYLDTASKQVELYWWTERASYPLSSNAVANIDEWAEEYYSI